MELYNIYSLVTGLFSLCIVFMDHPVVAWISTSFLFLPFYGWVISHCTDIPYFVYSSTVDEYLGCFLVLAVVNNVVRNTYIQVLFEQPFSVLMDMYVGVQLLGYMVISVFNLLKNCHILPQWLYYLTFASAMYGGSSFSTWLPPLLNVLLICHHPVIFYELE